MPPKTILLDGHRIRVTGGYRRYGAIRVKTCARFMEDHWRAMHKLAKRFNTTFQEVHDIVIAAGLAAAEREMKRLQRTQEGEN